jgi:hypothetical protein
MCRRPCRLEQFIDRYGYGDAVKPYYAIDQADGPALGAIYRREFGETPFDLVVDDASHRTALACPPRRAASRARWSPAHAMARCRTSDPHRPWSPDTTRTPRIQNGPGQAKRLRLRARPDTTTQGCAKPVVAGELGNAGAGRTLGSAHPCTRSGMTSLPP